jgi:ParB-like chromosome segregation protein Spo0J
MLEIEMPQIELVEIEKLQLDGCNPNKMKKGQLKALKDSILKWGFIIPIITNRDLLLSDGEQRLEVAKELGMKKVPVIRLDVEDVSRRLLRQVLNKLRGQHVPELDKEEFLRIIEAGGEEDLRKLLVASDKQIREALSQEEQNGLYLDTQYEVTVECIDEIEQKKTYEYLTEKGYKCRVLTL